MRRRLRIQGPRRLLMLGASLVVIALGVPAAGANAAGVSAPRPAAPTVLDGPSPAIVGLSGISIARDGTGAVVYLKQVGGVPHVFISRLTGTFQSPQQLDAGLPGPSSQPVIAAGGGGLLLVAFINAGQLYVVDRANANTPFSPPASLAGAASNPAIAITNLGKAYLAFTASGSGGHDVRCAYYYQGSWGLESGALDAVPADDAGTGAGRPAVAASGDGVGIVAWGEGGHIFSRRVWATAPSVVYEQADVSSIGGWNEVSSSQPSIATGGNSSYVAVAFNETVASGSQQQSRVLMRQLVGSVYNGAVQADGLSTPGPQGAEDPQVAVGEYGQGFVTSGTDGSHAVTAMQLNSNESPGSTSTLDARPNSGPPLAVPAAAGYHSALIAWQQTPFGANADVRARFFDGSSFGQEEVLSSPAMGPTAAAEGLDAAGDIAADAAVGWVQGTSGSRAIVVAQLYQAPGSFQAVQRLSYVRAAKPTLSWSPSREFWGPVRYAVSVERALVGQTTGTSIHLSAPLSQGPHRWQVTARNPAGLSTTTGAATVFVDTTRPRARIRLRGAQRVGSKLEISVRATDTVGVRRADASGIKSIRVKWGDGTSSVIHRSARHAYVSARLYKITVTVSDRAGNKRKLAVKVRIGGSALKPRLKHAG